MREAGSGMLQSGPIVAAHWPYMAITGRNQNASGSDPACLLGLQNTCVTIMVGVRIGGGGLSALGKGQGRLKALGNV